MNNICYFEIQADDPDRAIRFYSEVFDWVFMKSPTLPIDYWEIKTEGFFGGLMKRPTQAPSAGQGTNAFVCSMEVEDYDAIAGKILQQGGAVALEKFAVPGKCWQGYFFDTEGNTFGLFEVDENAK